MNENLKKWVCSFSGCDGGNINSDIWLCGIESGYSQGTKEEIKNYYQEKLKCEIEKGKVENPRENFSWKDSLTYTYGRNFAKLYKAIKGEKVDDYRNIENNEDLFKLNLYPIAFPSTDHRFWTEYNLYEATGFKDKYLFNIWCFFNRFSFFSKIRKENNPKLIICTGVDYLKDFLMCFGAENINKIETGNIKAESDANKTKNGRTYYWVKVDKTLLVVIPFFSGRYGLNSNHLLQEMGSEIKKLLK